jgi:hypothetical protein
VLKVASVVSHLEAVAGDVDQVRGAFGIGEVWEQRIVVHVVALALVVQDRPVAGAAGHLDEHDSRAEITEHKRPICAAIAGVAAKRRVPGYWGEAVGTSCRHSYWPKGLNLCKCQKHLKMSSLAPQYSEYDVMFLSSSIQLKNASFA